MPVNGVSKSRPILFTMRVSIAEQAQITAIASANHDGDRTAAIRELVRVAYERLPDGVAAAKATAAEIKRLDYKLTPAPKLCGAKNGAHVCIHLKGHDVGPWGSEHETAAEDGYYATWKGNKKARWRRVVGGYRVAEGVVGAGASVRKKATTPRRKKAAKAHKKPAPVRTSARAKPKPARVRKSAERRKLRATKTAAAKTRKQIKTRVIARRTATKRLARKGHKR